MEQEEVTMSKVDYKMREALQSYITKVYPEETLREVLFALEETNAWLRRLILGPYISFFMTRYYFIGLTNKRILLMPVKSLKLEGEVEQIMLDRVSNMTWKEGVFSGKLVIEYSEFDRRVLEVGPDHFENASCFVNIYSLLPKPIKSDAPKPTNKPCPNCGKLLPRNTNTCVYCNQTMPEGFWQSW
jgi:hypothetical protein